jgi:hypothetical protein
MTTSCPYHDGMHVKRPDLPLASHCPLQQLADHTITVTEARKPGVGVVMVLVDAEDHAHVAIGSNLHPQILAKALEQKAAQLRALAPAMSFEHWPRP